METQPPLLEACVIYSERDAEYKDDLTAYLRLLRSYRLLGGVQYIEVGKLDVQQLTERLDGVDMVFFLVSIDLLTDDFFKSSLFKRILKFHQLKRLRVVPILVRECPSYRDVFKKIPLVPPGGTPIAHSQWASRDNAYLEVFNSLTEICRQAGEYKTSLEEAWSDAEKTGTVESYSHFLKKHPYSLYARQARKAIDKMTEEHLWKEAVENDDVESYFHYLVNSPLNEYRYQAGGKIEEIEDDEERLWAVAQDSEQLELYFHYQNQFPKGKYVHQAKEIVREKLKMPETEISGEDNAVESNYLMMTAFEQLDPSEIFSLQTYENYLSSLKYKEEELLKRLVSNKTAYPVLYLGFFLFEFMAYVVYNFMTTEEGAGADTSGLGTLGWGVVITLNAYILWRMYRSFAYMEKDIALLYKIVTYLKTLTTLLKVAFLTYDKQSAKNIVKFVALIEDRARVVNKKTVYSYLFPLEEHAESIEKKLPS
jgi:hypothetical protein